jgi:hypothetical protein
MWLRGQPAEAGRPPAEMTRLTAGAAPADGPDRTGGCQVDDPRCGVLSGETDHFTSSYVILNLIYVLASSMGGASNDAAGSRGIYRWLLALNER